jgi:cell division protease FtsH
MVTIYGMNEKVGNVSFYDPAQENSFVKPYSEETSKLIDEEVRKLIDKAYERTKELLTQKDTEVKKLAEALLDKEVLFQSDVETLIGKRPYEEKRALDVSDHTQPEHSKVAMNENGTVTGTTVNPAATEEVK